MIQLSKKLIKKKSNEVNKILFSNWNGSIELLVFKKTRRKKWTTPKNTNCVMWLSLSQIREAITMIYKSVIGKNVQNSVYRLKGQFMFWMNV